eukprot:gene9965-2284_t
MSDTETDTSITFEREQNRTPNVTPRKNPMLSNFSPMRKPEALIEENDDEEEKQRNRARDELKRRRSSFHVKKVVISPQNNAKRRKSRAIRRLTPDGLADLFNNCIKLSTENKINAKNSWNLNLIDYIDEVIENNTDTNQSNFQVASCTLDASIKIYSCRVDSVHTETYKVLGELNRTDKKKETTEQFELEPKEGEEVEEKKKKKSKVGHSTLETNLNNLNLKKFEMENSIQPLSYKNISNYDVGSAQSLLLNNLSISETCEIILDQAAYSMFKTDDDNEQTESITIEKGLFVDTSTNSNVVTEEENVTDENYQEMEVEDTVEPVAPNFDDVEDDVGPTLFDADFGDDDDFEQTNENDGHKLPESALDEKETKVSNHASTANLVEKILMESESIVDFANEYSYVMVDNIHSKKNWSGLNHWKVPKPKDETKPKKRSEIKLKELINFESFDYDSSLFEVSSSVSSNCMANSTLSKQNSTTNILPVDVHYSIETLMKPFGIPLKTEAHTLRVSSKNDDKSPKKNLNIYEDDDFGSHDYGGFDDDEVEGRPLLLGENLVGTEETLKEDPKEVLLDLTNFEKMKLVDAPQKAEKLKIGYAKTSTKVDVKLLKDDILHEIKAKENKYQFSDVVGGVRTSESKTPANVSIPYCFICLLHLANENGLEINGKEDLSDLSIAYPQ